MVGRNFLSALQVEAHTRVVGRGAHHNINPTCLLILYQSKPARRLHLQIASLIKTHHILEAAWLLKPHQVVKGSLLRQVYVRTWNTAVQHSKRERESSTPSSTGNLRPQRKHHHGIQEHGYGSQSPVPG